MGLLLELVDDKRIALRGAGTRGIGRPRSVGVSSNSEPPCGALLDGAVRQVRARVPLDQESTCGSAQTGHGRDGDGVATDVGDRAHAYERVRHYPVGYARSRWAAVRACLHTVTHLRQWTAVAAATPANLGRWCDTNGHLVGSIAGHTYC